MNYMRTITMPADSLILGKRHRHSHHNVITRGKGYYVQDDGIPVKFTAPHSFVSEAGAQKIVYCETDVEWSTFHIVDNTDVDDFYRRHTFEFNPANPGEVLP